ncbi:hypothetical protein PVAP13_2NG361003 [Panicum virgatum]|uniref:Uncharacterized protein n=1 Tax=Panicum virgatum TaxID=38727 RepID=A0A8T0VLF6_PANVG|nr:hypothetical protein PVAP13_2NG361003 [Panicum virgatum]
MSPAAYLAHRMSSATCVRQRSAASPTGPLPSKGSPTTSRNTTDPEPPNLNTLTRLVSAGRRRMRSWWAPRAQEGRRGVAGPRWAELSNNFPSGDCSQICHSVAAGVRPN